MHNIVIAGGGTAGWMAAAALGRFLGNKYNITLIESDAIGTVGVGEATIPQIRLFNAGLGIDERQFVAATQGTFKLGIEFDGWQRHGHHYIHAFGNIGRSLGLIPYHHYWLRGLKEGVASDLWSASPCAKAAAKNKFSIITEQAGKPPSGVTYAYQFDAGLYAKFLADFTKEYGVKRIEGEIVSVEQNGEDGNISALKLANGSTVAGDFFIDCTGFRGLLIADALGAGFDDWSHWLPCDRAVTVPCENVGPTTPFTRATAKQAGWQWRIPLQHRTGNGHVYSSAYISDDEATAVLLDGIDGPAMAEPKILKFKTGKRQVHWVKNCVALGLSAGFMEPLESTSIHLIQSAIARLLQLLPAANASGAAIAEYNRQSNFEWQSIRDFLILHYYANGRDEAFWAALRHMSVPDSLLHKIALFESDAGIFREHEELFTETGWLQVLWGQGVRPRQYHPLADQLSKKDLADFLTLGDRFADAQVGKMTDHQEFIDRHFAGVRPVGARN